MKFSLAITFLLFILVGCMSKPNQTAGLISNTATTPPTIGITAPLAETLQGTLKPGLTPTPIPTSTIPVSTQNAAATLGALDSLCDEFESDSSRSSDMSPDGKWFAISCGYIRNQVLIVQNQEGTKWVFEFANFIGQNLQGGMGGFKLMAWNSDSRFLYFTKLLGYDGGGNQCFRGYGVYGLYRLHLKTGTLVTLVSSRDDRFPGDEIRFSPTNEYYAVDINGITITNLESGEITNIEVSNVMEMSWSPDGKFLAFSVARCGENFVESSSIYVWDSTTKQQQVLFSSEEMLLLPRSWIDNSVLEFEGEQRVNDDYQYTIFQYDSENSTMVFSGTATPRP